MLRDEWSGRLDLNQRPPDPQSGALPGCATPRGCERELSQEPRGVSRSQPGPQGGEALADPLEGIRVRGLAQAQVQLLRARLARLGQEPLLGTLEGEALVVQQRLDALDELDVARAIEPLAGRVLLGPEQLELRLPVAEHIGRDLGDLLDLTDAVVQLLGKV